MPATLANASPWTCGRYLRVRREAAGRSPADVAAGFSTEPRLSELARIALVEQAERDETTVSVTIAAAYLRAGVRFDARVLIALVPPTSTIVPQICERCGCSWNDPCLDDELRGCSWVADGLCSSCGDRALPAAQAA